MTPAPCLITPEQVTHEAKGSTMRTISTILTAAVIAVAPTVLFTTPVAHAFPWSNCEDTATTTAEFNACDAEIRQAMGQCDTTFVGDYPDIQACITKLNARSQALLDRESKIRPASPH